MMTFDEILSRAGRTGAMNPYIIAEIGVNHEGSLEIAKELIDQVARAGGDAAKFQTYKAELLAAEGHSPSYWSLEANPCTSQHELFQRYDGFTTDDFVELANHCKEQGVDFLSTAFDLDAVDQLDPLMDYFKVASADITNIPLLRKIGSKLKPVIVSTGAATLGETEECVQTLIDAGATDVALLHCVLNYPTPPEHAQLGVMRVLKRVFGGEHHIGYSDHVAPEADGSMPALEYAVLAGATILEKHFSQDKSLPGNDHFHAMDEQDLANFVGRLEVFRRLHGSETRHMEWETQAIDNARRRIIAARDISANDVLTEDMLIALRANTGIEVSHWDRVVGAPTAGDIPAGTPINWNMIA